MKHILYSIPLALALSHSVNAGGYAEPIYEPQVIVEDQCKTFLIFRFCDVINPSPKREKEDKERTYEPPQDKDEVDQEPPKSVPAPDPKEPAVEAPEKPVEPPQEEPAPTPTPEPEQPVEKPHKPGKDKGHKHKHKEKHRD